MTRARDLANIADGTFTATDLDLSGTLTVSGDATFDTNTLFVDVSANAVGVGTTSPSARLDVVSDVTTAALIQSSAVATTLAINNTHANAWGSNLAIRTGGVDSGYFGTIGSLLGSTSQDLTVYATAGNGFRVYTNGNNERMRIDTSGNVQIKSGNEVQLYRADNGVAVDLYNGGSGVGLVLDDNNGDGFQFKFAGSEKMRIGSSGGVSIGNTVDLGAKSLNVGTASGVSVGDFVGQVNFQGYTSTYGAGIKSYVPSTAPGIDYQDLRFHTSSGPSAINVERMRIDSSGNLLVGTTTSIVTSSERVSFVGPVGLSVQSNGGASSHAGAFWNTATTGDNMLVRLYTDTGSSQRGSIDYNRAGGLVRYNTTSDYRAKDILGPVENAGATIDALKVYEGVMKGATQSRPMLIAHEAQEQAPYAVSGTKDAVNEDGTPDYQQIDHSSLVPLLIAEIQSLRARVAQLEGA